MSKQKVWPTADLNEKSNKKNSKDNKTQPKFKTITWMTRPNPIPGCSPGLEYMVGLDKLQIQQHAELEPKFTGWEAENFYGIFNSNGQQIYYAFETVDKSSVVHLVDCENQEVLRATCRSQCCCCCWCADCCNCCAIETTVSLPNGEIIGYVRQRGSYGVPKYGIFDSSHTQALTIRGPRCLCGALDCCFPCDQEFQVVDTNGTSSGKIAKVYGGFFRELFTKTDSFRVYFPMDLNVKLKATMLCASFLIDVMHYEVEIEIGEIDMGGGG